MSLTAEVTHILRGTELDAFGTSGRTVVHRVQTARLGGSTRHDSKVYTLSAGLSQVTLNLAPIGASQPGQLLWVATDGPIDLRINEVSGLLLSAVYGLQLAMSSISSLHVTPPASANVVLRVEIFGGGVLSMDTPLP